MRPTMFDADVRVDLGPVADVLAVPLMIPSNRPAGARESPSPMISPVESFSPPGKAPG